MLTIRHPIDFPHSRIDLEALEGFALDDLMAELGRLELSALGYV